MGLVDCHCSCYGAKYSPRAPWDADADSCAHSPVARSSSTAGWWPAEAAAWHGRAYSGVRGGGVGSGRAG